MGKDKDVNPRKKMQGMPGIEFSVCLTLQKRWLLLQLHGETGVRSFMKPDSSFDGGSS